MLAVRSGRYEDVEAMLDLCTIDFCVIGKPSAWDLTLLIGDPQMIQIMSEGRVRGQKREWRKQEQKLEEALEELPDFEAVLNWNCSSSWIPFLQHISPSKNYTLRKSGSRFRIDSNAQSIIYSQGKIW